MLHKPQDENSVRPDVELGEDPEQRLLARRFYPDVLVDDEAVVDPVVAVAGAHHKELEAPGDHVYEGGRYEDAEDPEPEECVDALVEEVECEDTLDGVCVHGSQLLCFDVTDGDPSH